MKKVLKKSEVLKEGYIKGLKEAQRIINEMLNEGRMNKSICNDMITAARRAEKNARKEGKSASDIRWDMESAMEDVWYSRKKINSFDERYQGACVDSPEWDEAASIVFK